MCIFVETLSKVKKIKNKKMENLSFEIEKDGKEFHVWCPELPGCHSHGKTINESLEHLKDAVNLYLEILMEEQIVKKSLELTL